MVALFHGIALVVVHFSGAEVELGTELSAVDDVVIDVALISCKYNCIL